MLAAGGARAARGLTRVPPGATALPADGRVRLVSRGCVLVCGPAALAVPAGEQLARTLRVVVCATGTVPRSGLRANPVMMLGRIGRVAGHLGRFTVAAFGGDNRLADLGPFSANRDGFFDLVLDLNTPPLLATALPPAGYYAPGAAPAAIAAAVAELATLTGDFDQPRYCHYEAARCAHGAKGHTGCKRCLDACPTGALRSAGERIMVDAALCQGCGGCTLACPSGALRDAAADSGALFRRLAQLCGEHQAAGRPLPGLCLREAGDAAGGTAGAPELATFVLPALAAVGPEFWLTALASGVPRIVVLPPADLPRSTRRVLDAEVVLAQTLLAAIGESPARIVVAAAGAPVVLCGDDSSAAGVPVVLSGGDPSAAGTGMVPLAAEPLAVPGMAEGAVLDKRAAIHEALERLAAQHRRLAAGRPEAVNLPADAPFGTVTVDPVACTVCLACAHACPSQALRADEAERRLRFTESRCLQCGLCAGVCPEQALALRPRLLRDAAARREERTLAEDGRHACPGCGTPFVGAAVLDRSLQFLRAQGMLDAAAAARLHYCPACRCAPSGT